MINKTNKCECGKVKKPWFPKCFECIQKDNQKPKCEICNKEIPEGHNLCKEHWKEQQEAKKKIKQVEYVQKKVKTDFKEKFEGKYYFNSQKMKSKSELLICYFLTANDINFTYEPPMNLNGHVVRPDFILHDKKGNSIILEHFGMDSIEYKKKQEIKEKEYRELCKKEKEYYFVSTNEEDMFDLKEKLGNKLNKTPINKVMWK